MTAAGIILKADLLMYGGVVLLGTAAVLWLVAWGRAEDTSVAKPNQPATPSVDQRVTSINQAGGITAHVVNTKPPQRTLADPMGMDLLRKLDAKSKTDSYEVAVSSNTPEAYTFAVEVRDYMRASGFNVSPIISTNMVLGSPPVGARIHRYAYGKGVEPSGPWMVDIGHHPDA